MTFCSTFTAAKKLLLFCCQSTIRTGIPARAVMMSRPIWRT